MKLVSKVMFGVCLLCVSVHCHMYTMKRCSSSYPDLVGIEKLSIILQELGKKPPEEVAKKLEEYSDSLSGGVNERAKFLALSFKKAVTTLELDTKAIKKLKETASFGTLYQCVYLLCKNYLDGLAEKNSKSVGEFVLCEDSFCDEDEGESE